MKLEYLPGGSPDCPLIRLYDFRQTEAKRLKELVKSLATGDRENVALHNEAWVESVDGCSLNLRRGNRDQGIRQSQTLRFECVLSSDGWSNLEGLLEPFSTQLVSNGLPTAAESLSSSLGAASGH